MHRWRWEGYACRHFCWMMGACFCVLWGCAFRSHRKSHRHYCALPLLKRTTSKQNICLRRIFVARTETCIINSAPSGGWSRRWIRHRHLQIQDVLSASPLQDLPAVRELFSPPLWVIWKVHWQAGSGGWREVFWYNRLPDFFDKFYVDLLLGVSLMLTAEY